MARKTVKLGPLTRACAWCAKGSRGGWVVTRGLQRARTGQKVAPKREVITVSEAPGPRYRRTEEAGVNSNGSLSPSSFTMGRGSGVGAASYAGAEQVSAPHPNPLPACPRSQLKMRGKIGAWASGERES